MDHDFDNQPYSTWAMLRHVRLGPAAQLRPGLLETTSATSRTGGGVASLIDPRAPVT